MFAVLSLIYNGVFRFEMRILQGMNTSDVGQNIQHIHVPKLLINSVPAQLKVSDK